MGVLSQDYGNVPFAKFPIMAMHDKLYPNGKGGKKEKQMVHVN